MARALITAADCKELPIPQGLVAWWTGTVATIPYGWEVANGQASVNDPTFTRPNLLGRYPKGATNAGGLGGNNIHSHEVPHTHTIGDSPDPAEWLAYNPNNPANYGNTRHNHGGTTQSTTVTTSTASSEPPYLEAIPIVYTLKGNSARGLLTLADFGPSAVLPLRIIAMFTGTLPARWALCDGSTVRGITTPNLTGKYLKGVASAGGPTGATGGALTHNHTANHAHATGYADSYCSRDAPWDYTAFMINKNHNHAISGSTTTQNGSNEPAYINVKYALFTGYGANNGAKADGHIRDADLKAELLTPRGLMMLMVDTSDMTGFAFADGQPWANGVPNGHGANRPNMLGRYVKHVATAASDGGATGGSLAAHNHTGPDHTHPLPGATGGYPGGYDPPNQWNTYVAIAGHGHPMTGGAFTTNSVVSEPPYYEVSFVVRD